MERQELNFKVGNLVKVEDGDYVGTALVVGFHGFCYTGEPRFICLQPIVPFSSHTSHITWFDQNKLTLIRHIEMPEMDVMAVDATAEMVSEEVHQGV
jgi:hypothetical protein